MSTTKNEAFNNLIQKIKTRIGLAEEPAAGDAAPPMELKEYTTDNGAVVNIDRLEVGGKVTNADGAPVAGDTTLTDGTMIAVDQAGTITAITAPVEQAAEPEAPAPAAAPVAMEAMEAKFAAQEMSFKALLAEEKKAREADAQKFGAVVKDLLDLVQKFAEEPAAEPIQKPQNGTVAESKKERGARLMAAARAAAEAKANV